MRRQRQPGVGRHRAAQRVERAVRRGDADARHRPAADGSAVISGVAINNTNVYPGEQNFPLSGTSPARPRWSAWRRRRLLDRAGARVLDVQTTAAGYTLHDPADVLAAPAGRVSPADPPGRRRRRDGWARRSSTSWTPPRRLRRAARWWSRSTWDTEADLDLHVVMPNVDRSRPRPSRSGPSTRSGSPPAVLGGPPIYPDQIANAAAILDFDSNGNCAIDGRRQENIIYTQWRRRRATTPSASTPLAVRPGGRAVDGDGATPTDGTSLGFVQWESTDAATRGSSRRRRRACWPSHSIYASIHVSMKGSWKGET